MINEFRVFIKMQGALGIKNFEVVDRLPEINMGYAIIGGSVLIGYFKILNIIIAQ